MQGSGTFSVEAAVNTLVPRDGHVLVLINGAYGTRMAKLTQMMGRKLTSFETAENVPTTPQDVDRLLERDPSITHVGPHPLRDVDRHPESAARYRRGRGAPRPEPDRRCDELVRGARHRRADDAVRRADRGVGQMRRGAARDGLRVRAQKGVLERCAGNSTSLALDLHDQWTYMEKTTQWRFTPPTHVVVALNAALDQFVAEGGQPARLARYAPIARRSCAAWRAGVRGRSSRRRSRRRSSSPSTRRRIRATRSRRFYERVRDKGFILYPGKLTQVETFRVGCIGAIGPDEMRHAVNAMRDTLAEMGDPADWSGRDDPRRGLVTQSHCRQLARRPDAAAHRALLVGSVARNRAVPQQEIEHDEARSRR